MDAHVESLHALPLERHEGLSWGECWVVADLSHPAFCSARELTARAALLGEHALDVFEGLTVRMQRVHVEVLESVRSAVNSEVASSFASFQVTEEGGLGERPPANATGSLKQTVLRPPLEALYRSRSALGLSPPVVVDVGLDPDKQVAGKAELTRRCPYL